MTSIVFRSPASSFAGGRNGYFDALLPAEELHSALPLPALSSLYHPAPHSQACQAWSPLTAQLGLCAAQRIHTLHEQLLHQQYTCPLILADPARKAVAALKANPSAAPAVPDAAAPSTDDTQQSLEAQEPGSAPMAGVPGQDLHHSSSKGKVIAEVIAGITPANLITEVTPEVRVAGSGEIITGSGAQVTIDLQTELQQLADQVLQHAASLLKPQTRSGSTSISSNTAAEQPEYRRRNENPSDFWLAMLPLLPTVAIYAPQGSLRNFLRQLISCSIPDVMLTSSGASDTDLSPAFHSASDAASAAQVTAGCLEQPSFLEQSQLQQAWLQAIQQELLSEVTQLHSASASSVESLESLHAQLGGTSKKRRKSQGAAQAGTDSVKDSSAAEGLTHRGCSPAPKPDLHTVLIQTLQVVTPLLTTDQPAASEAATEADMEADIAASGKHNSNSKAGSAAKKRKKAEGQSSKAAQTSPMLRHVTGLLQHVALMPLAMLSSTHAASLAQALLQTQLLLAQSAVYFATAAAAAVNALADDNALGRIVHALVSSQQGIARCLKGSSDAAAAGLLLHAGPQLWRWLRVAAQLTSHLQSQMSLSSTTNVPLADTPYSPTSSRTPRPALELHSLPAGRRRSPAIGSNDPSFMVHSASTSMLQEVSASIRCLAGYCLCTTSTAETANADDDVGFQTFATGLAEELQVRVLVGCCVMHC